MAFQTFTQEEIAKNLKRIRKERKLNQKQLAALLDKSERTKIGRASCRERVSASV